MSILRNLVIVLSCWLVAAPASAQEGPWPHLALATGAGLDWVTTHRVLSLSPQYEGNPLVGRNTWGQLAIKTASTAFTSWTMRKIGKAGHPRIARWLGYSAGAGLTVIAIHNERLYRDRRDWRRRCVALGCQ